MADIDETMTAAGRHFRPPPKPVGTGYLVACIVLTLVSFLIGGLILAVAAVGFGIAAKRVHQPYASAALALAAVALVINGIALSVLFI